MAVVTIETHHGLIGSRVSSELKARGFEVVERITESRAEGLEFLLLAGLYILKVSVDKAAGEAIDEVVAAIKSAVRRRSPAPAKPEVPIYGPSGEVLRVVEIDDSAPPSPGSVESP